MILGEQATVLAGVCGWVDTEMRGMSRHVSPPSWTPEGSGVQAKHFVGCGFEEFEESLSRPCQPWTVAGEGRWVLALSTLAAP